MANSNVDSLTAALENTRVTDSGVSFAGKSLKLDSEEDAKQVTTEIDKCTNLQYLNMEGNTLGVDASKEIATALGKHPEFRRALWKDMFTGRMKDEIPKSLQFLGEGLVTSGAQLTELDLSDNAFGPIGVEGLAALLRSPCCYALEELRLNNNGLGMTGGKLLAAALTDCYNNSKEQGKPLALKVFIAGRNRLENEGSKALAAVFKLIGKLEEIAMPQNGIYHVGIAALSEAFAVNKNLQILNLNDNTLGVKGTASIAAAIANNQNLRDLNLGDCLLKTKGAVLLANSLKTAHLNLEELNLSYNEIKVNGGLDIVDAIANKNKLKTLNIDGNQFGPTGIESIKKRLKEIGKINVLSPLDGDEDADSEEEEGSDDEETEEEDDEETEEDDEENGEDKEPNGKDFSTEDVYSIASPMKLQFSVKQFLETPSASNFIALGNDRVQLILKEAQNDGNILVEDYVRIIMKVSALGDNMKKEVADSSLECAEKLYKDLFSWAQKSNKLSIVNNTILVSLGLIKSEDKKFKPTWNLDGCLKVLKHVTTKNYVPDSTKDSIKVFIKRQLDEDKNKEVLSIKKEILSALK